ncbi:MAG: hypothetical protein U0795_22085 [Pirellulales bacterium]
MVIRGSDGSYLDEMEFNWDTTAIDIVESSEYFVVVDVINGSCQWIAKSGKLSMASCWSSPFLIRGTTYCKDRNQFVAFGGNDDCDMECMLRLEPTGMVIVGSVPGLYFAWCDGGRSIVNCDGCVFDSSSLSLVRHLDFGGSES